MLAHRLSSGKLSSSKLSSSKNIEDSFIGRASQIKAGLCAFFNIMDEWDIDISQGKILLGNMKNTRFHELKKLKSGNLSDDELDRLSYIIGIYTALKILFSDRNAKLWLHNNNQDPLFCGKSPLNYMLSGKLVALSDVRRYLDAARG